MKTAFTFLCLTFLCLASVAQNFEGEMIYKNSYKIKIPGITNEKFTEMMGTRQEYYVKGGEYKSINNGSLVQWQAYINKENKLYTKMSSSEEALWNDGAVNDDEVLKAEINKGVTEVLGYKCDELVLTCKTGIQKYYFNTKFGIDPKLYSNHKFGNWYEIISRTKALPLKMIIDNAQFSLESIAEEIKPMKLEQSFFYLPAGIATKKSPH